MSLNRRSTRGEIAGDRGGRAVFFKHEKQIMAPPTVSSNRGPDTLKSDTWFDVLQSR